MSNIIQFARGLFSALTAANPVLQSGRAAVETDKGRMKVGDGVTNYNSLPYIGYKNDNLTQGSVLFAGTGGVTSQDNAGLFYDLTNDRLGIGTNAPQSTLHIKGTAATDQPTLGHEFLTDSGWTSTNWTGSRSGGWTHTTGNASVLSFSTVAVNATRYQITYTVTGRTVGAFDLQFGGQTQTGISATGSFGPTTISTANLTITPTSTFDGTIVISIKEITAISNSIVTCASLDGTVRTEIRANASAYNTFIGTGAGNYCTTGYYNTTSGFWSQFNLTTGYNNTAQGVGSQYSLTTGYNNTAQGASSQSNLTAGYNNTAQGVSIQSSLTTGYNNTAQGMSSQPSLTTGYNNTAQGVSSQSSLTTGYNNTANGVSSQFSLTTGYSNSSFGNSSLFDLTVGIKNAAIGDSAGKLLGNFTTIGSYNTFLGADTGPGPQASLTSGTLKTVTVAAGGTGYVIGDVLNLLGATVNSQVIITGVSSGAVTSATVSTAGGPYTVASVYTTSNAVGSGTGCTFTIASVELWMTTCVGANSTSIKSNSVILGDPSGSLTCVGIGTNNPQSRLDIQCPTTDATTGSELIIATADRDFTSSTGNWTGTNWAVQSGRGEHTAPGANAFTLNSAAITGGIVVGKQYRIIFDITTTTNGSISVVIGGTTANTFILTTGTGTVAGITTVSPAILSTASISFTPDGTWMGYIDNVSIVAITATNTPALTIRSKSGVSSMEFRNQQTTSSYFGLDSGKVAQAVAKYNCSLGYNTFTNLLSGTNNSAMGYSTLKNLVNGSWNTALGSQVLSALTSGSYNVGIGYNSLQSLFNTSENVAIGAFSQGSATIGASNVSVGTRALFANIAGSQNVAIGDRALSNHVYGSSNDALGYFSLFTDVSGTLNTAIGHQAGYNNSTGIQNTFIGANTGSGSTASTPLGSVKTVTIAAGGTNYTVGNVLTIQSGILLATATVATVSVGSVTAVTITYGGTGYSTGVKTTTVDAGSGSGCTITVATIDIYNVTCLGNGAISTKSNAVILGDPNNTNICVGIGTTSPQTALEVKGLTGIRISGATSGYTDLKSATTGSNLTFQLPSAIATAGQQLTDASGNGVLSWAAASSTRETKEIIGQYSDLSKALSTIINTPVYNFQYKEGMGTGDHNTVYTGVMADEAKWAMHHDNSIVNPVNTLGYMILGMKALSEKIEKLISLETENSSAIMELRSQLKSKGIIE